MDINKKIENVINLSANDRYDYFIRKVCDFEKIWGLYNDGWAMMNGNDEKQVIPFWPEKEFARICAVGKWKKYEPKSIDIYEFIDKWLLGMYKDGINIGVFCTPAGKVVIEYPHKVQADLEKELEQYE